MKCMEKCSLKYNLLLSVVADISSLSTLEAEAEGLL